MRHRNTRSSTLSAFLLLFFTITANAQVFTGEGYYYNNFDNGQLGSGFTQLGTSAALAVSSTPAANNLSVENGYSLSSTGNGVAGGFALSFIPNGTALNNEPGYEWTMLYRNNGGNPDNSDVIDNNENSWKYWLYANNTDAADLKGYYLTQMGSTLMLRLRNSQYDVRTLLSFDLSSIGGNNTTYAIRVQRLNRQGQFIWQLFVDPYTSSKREASTIRGGVNYEANLYNTYNYSALMVSSTSSQRFKFDEFKMYSIKLTISGANDSSFGVSNPLYPGQQNAVIYGLRLQTRGYFDLYQIVLSLTGNLTGIVEGTMKLNKSKDSYFGNADDSFLTNLSYYDSAIQNYNFNDTFYSVGNADGSLATTGYYFITVNVKSNPTNGATFNFTGIGTFNGSSSQTNYANNGSTTSVSTQPANSGNGYNWVGGTSSFWNVASNWSQNAVPGPNDLARIGVTDFTNQPVVSDSRTIGNVVFGSVKTATLSINAGATLTVNNNVDNKAGTTITGAGALEVKGSFISGSNTAISTLGSVNSLTVNNLVLDGQSAAVAYAWNGSNMVIKNTLQTLGNSAVSYTLGTNATVTLNAANPFSLAGNYTVSFVNGTVVYNAAALQNIPTSFAYNNIKFAGAGTKRVASGTLSVSGDWESADGRVDLQTNATVLSFGGAAQAINDLGSNAGNGLLFGNLLLSGGTKTLSTTGKFAIAIGAGLTLASNTTLNTSGNLTLKADQTGFASVYAIPSTSSIQGEVTVEKYVKGGSKDMWRTYRMLSSPVYDNVTSFVNTNVEGNRSFKFAQFKDDMIVTGKGGAANGFDATSSNSASAWTYDNGFIAIPNINTSVNVGRGAYLFYRGSRDNFNAKITSPFLDPESIVMTFRGTLNQQSITVTLTHGSTGYSLIGNPYAATVDWLKVTKTNNIEPVIRMWNPSNRQYSTYNGLDGINGGSRYIGPGQAVFVQTRNASSPSLTFTEASKVGSGAQNNAAYTYTMSTKEKNVHSSVMSTNGTMATEEVEPARVRIKLLRNDTENSDETLIVLKNGADAAYTGDDVPRYGGESVFLSSQSSDAQELAINYMPSMADVAKVGLSVNVNNAGAYTLSFALTDIPVGYGVKLKDNYLNTITDIYGDETYALNIDKNIAASFGANRFELLFAPATTLPVVLTSFTGQKVNEGVRLKWTTAEEVNNKRFEVYRAGEDKIYTLVDMVPAAQTGAYSLLDRAPLNGNNYYKLVQVDDNGKTTTFDPITVKFELNAKVAAGVVAYPTVVNAAFTLTYNGDLNSSNYLIKVVDITGKNVFNLPVNKATVAEGYQGSLSSAAAGIYFAELIDMSNGKSLGTSKLIKR